MALAHLKKWLHLVSQSQSRFWRSQSLAKGALSLCVCVGHLTIKTNCRKRLTLFLYHSLLGFQHIFAKICFSRIRPYFGCGLLIFDVQIYLLRYVLAGYGPASHVMSVGPT
jgi:hypothetical protein